MGDVEVTGNRGGGGEGLVVSLLATDDAAQCDLQLVNAGGVFGDAGKLLAEHADLRTGRRTRERTAHTAKCQAAQATDQTLGAAEDAAAKCCADALGDLHSA